MGSFPQGFDPADGHYIEVTIRTLPGAGIALDSIGAAPPTILRDLAGDVALRDAGGAALAQPDDRHRA